MSQNGESGLHCEEEEDEREEVNGKEEEEEEEHTSNMDQTRGDMQASTDSLDGKSLQNYGLPHNTLLSVLNLNYFHLNS
jgi:fructose-1,6-bisphosphatase